MMKKASTLIGVLLAFAAVVVSHMMDHGTVMELINIPAFVLIIGGTLAASIAATSMADFLAIGSGFKIIMNPAIPDLVQTKEQLVEMAKQARTAGILSLEKNAKNLTDPYLKHGILFIVDGMDPEEVDEQMETERLSLYQVEAAAGVFFDTAGGFAPTFGIIGTVVGLIAVLSSISDIAKLAPAIAVAFTATLWGVLTANAFWLPLGMRLKKIAQDRQLVREIQGAAVISIARGDTSVKLERQLEILLAGRLGKQGSEAKGKKNEKSNGTVAGPSEEVIR